MSARPLLGGCLLLILGCREVVGIETRTEGPPLLALPAECLGCVENACPQEERDCAADSACASLAACVSNHPDDPAGRRACEDASTLATSSASYLALDACLRAPCQDACTGIEGLLAGRSKDCDSCLSSACEPQFRACIADRACERTVSTAYTGTMSPPKAISVDNAPGAEGAPLRALDDCLGADDCVGVCGIDGTDFACAKSFVWPSAAVSSAPLDAEVLLTDLLIAQPVADVTVRACEPLSVPCVEVAAGTTDEHGVATVPINIPIQPFPFRGFASVFDPSPTPRFLPSNVFFGRPYYAPTWGRLNVFTRDTLELVADLGGTTPEPGLGQVIVLFLDCNGRLAEGVTLMPSDTLVVDESVTKVDYPGGPPTRDGLVVVLNAAPGCHDLWGVVESDEVYHGRIAVESDVITVALMYPSSNADELDSVCVLPP